MSKKWKHWCPNGCGKSAVSERYENKNTYYCNRCNTWFLKEDIMSFKKGEEYVVQEM